MRDRWRESRERFIEETLWLVMPLLILLGVVMIVVSLIDAVLRGGS